MWVWMLWEHECHSTKTHRTNQGSRAVGRGHVGKEQGDVMHVHVLRDRAAQPQSCHRLCLLLTCRLVSLLVNVCLQGRLPECGGAAG
jgi:hypothetical protein